MLVPRYALIKAFAIVRFLIIISVLMPVFVVLVPILAC